MIKFEILFFLFTTICFSQKQYKFDYLIETEITLFKDSLKIKNRPFRRTNKKLKKYYLTNSKNNAFSAIITEKDSLYYRMIFRDYNGIAFNVIVLKTDFNKAEFINVDCKFVKKYSNRYKYLINDYDFFILKDTIIDKLYYRKYKLTSIKPKKKKRKKLATLFYIIDKSTQFHLPILNFSTAYEEWKNNKNLPNGIFKEKYYIDYNGALDSNEILINYWRIDKKLIIQDECNYTNKID